ncbi:MAG: bacteriochlorophyll 4-vinyl reductase [Alphaproteobacteria bacterium]|jgi:divinyl protochlorophyllide a 8-vinyl-reductase|nr:bacteriochlorophyll 4-vinyl reductase [Alphaproteobacteria bacterium]
MQTHPSGRVGPNAILQMVEAVRMLSGPEVLDRVCAAAGMPGLVDNLPDRMIPAHDALSLHRAVAAELPQDAADRIAREAGRRTGDYILSHRIPAPARLVLRLLPGRLAGPILLRAISHHAWTFAGDARVTHDATPPMELVIHDNPLAMPGCPWHLAVFETLFHRLVDRRIIVGHSECCTDGAGACRFVFHQSRAAADHR